MNDILRPARTFSPLSAQAGCLRPGRKLLCSRDAQWQSLLVQIYEQPGSVDGFETLASPDPLVVFVLEGQYEIESLSSGAWKKAMYRPGIGGLTAAMTSNRLRWRSPLSSTKSQLIRIYIPQSYFEEVYDYYRSAGANSSVRVPDTLSFSDPVVFSVAKALADGVRLGAPDLYADAGARFLAAHLLAKINHWPEKVVNRGAGNCVPGEYVNDRRLLRALEYMAHRFMTRLTLDELAREAGISRFHFARLFKAKLGLSPHQHIVQLRLDHARDLLTDTDLSVLEIVGACGYVHDGHFAASFQRRFGVSPKAFRKPESEQPSGNSNRRIR